MDNRTLSRLDLHGQNKPFPAEPWKETSLDTQIRKPKNISGSHVGPFVDASNYHPHRQKPKKKPVKIFFFMLTNVNIES
ncbi:MAG: hypothetical protein KAJ06_06755 [Gammaproteobacteria bacterium]|nr:hypothetical protein [Gammaproteobacteria bacterium]